MLIVYIKPPTTSGHRPIRRNMWIQGTILQRQKIKIQRPAIHYYVPVQNMRVKLAQ